MRGIAEFLIHGRVGGDPELTVLTNGTSRCRASVCANIPQKKDNGWDHIPIWFNVAWFGSTAENIHKRLHKGAIVVMRGDITTYKSMVGDVNITNYNFRPRTTSIVDAPSQEQSDRPASQSTSQRPPASAPPPASSPPPASAPPPANASAQATQPPPAMPSNSDPFSDDDLPF